MAAPFSYVVGKIVEKWGILDPLADQIGEWLRINVPPAAVGWAVALVIFAALYGLLLWRVWSPRHIHHHIDASEVTQRTGGPQERKKTASEYAAEDQARTMRLAQGYAEAIPQALLNQADRAAAEHWIKPVQPPKSPVDKVLDAYSGPKREVSLAEALGWAAYGKWGEPFHGTPFTIALSGGPSIQHLLSLVTAGAREGRLTIWGKRDHPGHYEKIPQSHWEDNELALPDVFGSIATREENPYRNLMLSRTEVEREWPHEG
jgi:hypothetical protein